MRLKSAEVSGLIAYVEAVLGLPVEDEEKKEFRRFSTTVDTLNRWNERGPHAIRDPGKAIAYTFAR
jgi:hypothetical protein